MVTGLLGRTARGAKKTRSLLQFFIPGTMGCQPAFTVASAMLTSTRKVCQEIAGALGRRSGCLYVEGATLSGTEATFAWQALRAPRYFCVEGAAL